LVEPLVNHTRADAKPEDYVFSCNGGPGDDRAILRSVISPGAKLLGFYFEGFGRHSFRHQKLTLLQEEVLAQL